MNGGNIGSDRDVAVIGCGLMGSALARAFAANGYSVTAWNRTFERAEVLAGGGVTPEREVGDAIQPVRLVVACTATYETTRSALDSVKDWHGKTLVNLGTSIPEEAEEMERWATGRGATYLDGAIICYPPEIGGPEALILYSGSPEAWNEFREILTTLAGASRHVSEQVGSASVLDVAIVGAFSMGALGAYVEAATYALDRGIPLDVLDDLTGLVVGALAASTHEATVAIDSGNHETHTATISTYAEGGRAFLAAMQGAGLKARIPAAVLANLEEAEAAGLGGLGFSAQTRIAGEA